MLKIFIFFIIRNLIFIIDNIFFHKKRDILFHGYDGKPSGNCLALSEYLSNKNKIETELFWTGYTEHRSKHLHNYIDLPERDANIFIHFKFLLFLLKFKIIITESAGDLSFYKRFLSKYNRLFVLLPHGFCLKSSGLLSPSLSNNQKKIWKNVGKDFHIISASSKLERYMISSTFNCPIENVYLMGPQRPMNNNKSTNYLKKLALDLKKNTK